MKCLCAGIEQLPAIIRKKNSDIINSASNDKWTIIIFESLLIRELFNYDEDWEIGALISGYVASLWSYQMCLLGVGDGRI